MRAAPAIMSKLYPIIRRQRRPLVAVDVAPAPKQAGPVQSVAVLADGHQVEPAKSAPEQPEQKKTSDGDTQN